MKKNSMIIEFNESKQKGIDNIKKKYTSKISELKNYQNFEISNFDKITKGVIKPCSRIQSIVSSATGIKDEDEKNDEEENENENNNNNNTKDIQRKQNMEKDEEYTFKPKLNKGDIKSIFNKSKSIEKDKVNEIFINRYNKAREFYMTKKIKQLSNKDESYSTMLNEYL